MLTDQDIAAMRGRLKYARTVAGPWSTWLQVIADGDALLSEVERLRDKIKRLEASLDEYESDEMEDDWDTEDREPFRQAAMAWAREHGIAEPHWMGDGWTGEGICDDPPRFELLSVAYRDDAVPLQPDAPRSSSHLSVLVQRDHDGLYSCRGAWYNNHPAAPKP